MGKIFFILLFFMEEVLYKTKFMMQLCNYWLPTKKIVILHIHYSIHEWKKTFGKKWRLLKYIIWLGMSCYYCNIHSSNRQKRNWNFIINFPRIGKKRACYPLVCIYIYRYLYNILPTYISIFYIDKLVEKRQSQSSILISYGRGMN